MLLLFSIIKPCFCLMGSNPALLYALFISQLNPEHTKFMTVVQVDLGGKLMPSVIDSVMPISVMNAIVDFKAGIKTLKLAIPLKGFHSAEHSVRSPNSS
uniref:Uncharacterized protein n=1 Tax=Salvator merianae TaxID=96440 RepID=A0A8D0KEQ9_SALMN